MHLKSYLKSRSIINEIYTVHPLVCKISLEFKAALIHLLATWGLQNKLTYCDHVLKLLQPKCTQLLIYTFNRHIATLALALI